MTAPKPTSPLASHRLATQVEDPRTGQSVRRFQQIIGKMHLPQSARCAPVRVSGIYLCRECPRKFMYRYRLGLTPQVERSFALRVGTLYHRIMAGLVRSYSLEQSMMDASQYLNAEIEGWKSKCDDTMTLPDGSRLDALVADSERAFSLAAVMAAFSERHFFGRVLDGWELVDCERPIEITPKGFTGSIRCIPDAIYRKGDDLLIVDHKTHSGSTPVRAACVSFELQPAVERLCVDTAYHGVSTLFLHNIIRKTRLRFPAKKYPEWSDYLTAVENDYKDQQAANPDDPPLIQALTALVGPSYPDELRVVLKEATLACNCGIAPERFYRNDRACAGRYGNSPCPYLPLCKSGVDQWPDLVQRLYGQRFREDEEEETPDA